MYCLDTLNKINKGVDMYEDRDEPVDVDELFTEFEDQLAERYQVTVDCVDQDDVRARLSEGDMVEEVVEWAAEEYGFEEVAPSEYDYEE